MAKKIFIMMCLLILIYASDSFSATNKACSPEEKTSLARDFAIPPIEKILDWEPNEVPMNITVYYDLDDDNIPDMVVAYVMEGTWYFSTPPTHEESLRRNIIKRSGQEVKFKTNSQSNAVVYVIIELIENITMMKYLHECGDWLYPGKLYRSWN